MNRANYKILDSNEHRVLIQDIGPWTHYATITNNPNSVVDELAPRLNGRELHYIDSDGNLDKLLVKDGRFAGFAPIAAAFETETV